MSDRVRVYLNILIKDRQKVLDKFNLSSFDYEDQNGDILYVIMEDVNYAGWTELEQLAEEIDFVGAHDSGYDFGSFVFSSVDSTELLGLESGRGRGKFVVRMKRNNGHLEYNLNLTDIIKYCDQYKKFMGSDPF